MASKLGLALFSLLPWPQGREGILRSLNSGPNSYARLTACLPFNKGTHQSWVRGGRRSFRGIVRRLHDAPVCGSMVWVGIAITQTCLLDNVIAAPRAPGPPILPTPCKASLASSRSWTLASEHISSKWHERGGPLPHLESSSTQDSQAFIQGKSELSSLLGRGMFQLSN